MFFVCCSHLHLFQETMVSKSPRVPLITLVGICQDSVATCFRVWWFEFDFKSTPTPCYPLLILIIFTTVVPLAGYTTPIPPQNKRSIFCHDLCILMNNDFFWAILLVLAFDSGPGIEQMMQGHGISTRFTLLGCG